MTLKLSKVKRNTIPPSGGDAHDLNTSALTQNEKNVPRGYLMRLCPGDAPTVTDVPVRQS